MTPRADLSNAYRQTRYAATEVEVRIRRRSTAPGELLIAHGLRTGAFVTA
jgi:hypothetical protein